MAFLKVFIVAAHYKLDSHFLSRTTCPVQQLVQSYSILNISKNCLEVITFNLQFERTVTEVLSSLVIIISK